MNWYIKVLENYFNFKGRARRKEYWMFVLINMIVAIVIAVGSTLLDMKWLSTVYQFLVFIPSISVGVRRVHDTDHNGWFVIVPFYNLYLFCIDGDRKENRFGPDPKVEPSPTYTTT